jgi:putative RNA 2'-phosphotransferase
MQHISKFLSLILRHKPETVGIKLDGAGWANVDELLKGMHQQGKRVTLADLEQVVAEDNKGRYSLSPDKKKIRANQGHSVKVDLGLTPKQPPKDLFHGTPEKFVEIIKQEGLKPMQRHHVHLSADVETAETVGARRGKPHIFTIKTAQMIADGFEFYQSENGVWLVDKVPPQYLH